MKSKSFRSKANNILVVGKIPPPIGGVTIHVNRLLDSLKKDKIDFQFVNITIINIAKLFFRTIWQYPIIHLHTSSPILRFIFSIFNLFFKNSTLIITYHGNIGRFNTLNNWLDITSIKLVDIPIVLNEESFKLSKLLNKKVRLVPAFIPPVLSETLPGHISKKVNTLKDKYSIIFCTNAFNLSFDKDKNEIYGGKQLINLFSKLENKKFAFIFSDPSSNYSKYIEKSTSKITNNILLISEPHSFFEILKNSDCFIRNTTTDGDPLSVKEALILNKIVLASDVIKRPEGVKTFTWSKTNDLQNLINDFKRENNNVKITNGALELIKLYKELTNNKIK